MHTPVKIIDLFAGIGGFHTAFRNKGARVVFASEWDNHARQTYKLNYEADSPELFVNDEKLFAGDITKVDPESIPDFDVLCGGFPCQPFSNAGKGLGFEDARGTLFFQIANILKVKQPKAFFLENVRGLISHDEGRTLQIIEKTIDELGYSLSYKLIRASDYNVPQHRPRLFMVGFRKDLDAQFQWPEKQELTNTLDKVLKGKVTTLSGAERKIGFTIRVGGRQSGIHDRRNWDSYFVDDEIRHLTVDEARQMQGFPDSFRFDVSDSQAFKQLGNSVAVPAVEAVAEEIIKSLRN